MNTVTIFATRTYLPLMLVRAGRWVLMGAVLALLVGARPTPARASLVMALDLAELVGRSDHIAVVDVVSVHSAWDPKHERILSTIQLDVLETWKGPATPATRMTIVQPGGTVGDITMVVFGLSKFQPGERTLLFMRGSVGAASVVGMAQGKRPIFRDVPTGRWMADGPDRAGALFVGPNGAPIKPGAVSAENPFRRRPLDELRQDVRGILKAAR
jgi:hypothetical protein